MKFAVLLCVIFIGYGVSPVRAGSVVTLAETPELTGKVTLTAATVHVEASSSPADINLANILEADFGETPFHLDYFLGSTVAGNQLPAAWQEQDIGAVEVPGSVVATGGTFAMAGSGSAMSTKQKGGTVADALHFAGQPWTGDGQWTARVKEIDAKTPQAMSGLMLRDTTAPDPAMVSLGTTGDGNVGFAQHLTTGKSMLQPPVPVDIPVWLRMTRYGSSIFGAISSDGKTWDLIADANLKTSASPWIGLFTSNRKGLGKAVLDQVSFTPTPSFAQVLPPGVLLRSGSFLVGTFVHLSFDAANPDAAGDFLRNGKSMTIARSKIAAVTMLPISRSQIAQMGSHVGLLMKNGDVMDGDFDFINGSDVSITSVLLGISNYRRSEVRGCFLHALQAQPASYEIRLTDGSIVNANAVSNFKNGVMTIEEASGVSVPVSLDEVAQFRAGTSQAQSLSELAWKATPPPAAPAGNATPAANAAPEPSVECWEGPNQKQVMLVPAGTTVDFPLPGKFRAMCAWIAVSPDSPPNSQATIRVLADGKEIGRTPPFKAGEQPRLLRVTMQYPKTVTIEADSIYVGPKVLIIDPVALRDK